MSENENATEATTEATEATEATTEATEATEAIEAIADEQIDWELAGRLRTLGAIADEPEPEHIPTDEELATAAIHAAIDGAEADNAEDLLVAAARELVYLPPAQRGVVVLNSTLSYNDNATSAAKINAARKRVRIVQAELAEQLSTMPATAAERPDPTADLVPALVTSELLRAALERVEDRARETMAELPDWQRHRVSAAGWEAITRLQRTARWSNLLDSVVRAADATPPNATGGHGRRRVRPQSSGTRRRSSDRAPRENGERQTRQRVEVDWARADGLTVRYLDAEGVVHGDGTMEVAGESFATINAAAKAVNGGKSVNAREAWRLVGDIVAHGATYRAGSSLLDVIRV